jgi:catechol-2,3-dioxygenase
MSNRPNLHFSHIGFFARDLAKMTDFYTRVLGFTVTDRGDLAMPGGGSINMTFLSRDPEDHHQIALIDGRRPEQSAGVSFLHQCSFKVADLTTLKKLLVSLKNEGCGNIRTLTHGNAVSIYALDPDGNNLEFFVDTPWHVTQPMREPIDLTVSEAEILAAAEKHARAQPGFTTRAARLAEMAKVMG